MFPPLGGIAPLPLMAWSRSAAAPCLRRGAPAALSPSFGAPAAPVLWHAMQVVSYVLLPSAALAGAAAATFSPPPCGDAAAGAASAAGAGAGSGGIFAFISFTHAAYSSGALATTTIGMKPCSLPQIWLHWPR